MASLAINLGETGGNLIMGLLAAHDKRVQEAKAENSAVSAALAALVHDVQILQSGYNSGNITLAAAIQACIDIDNWYWLYIKPYSQYQNATPASCNPNQFGPTPKLSAKGVLCFQSTQEGTDFTAASYMGCNIVDANLAMLRNAFESLNGHAAGTTINVTFCGWPTNKYGLAPNVGMTLTLKVPSVTNPEEVTLSASGILSVGASPSASDAVIQQGAIATTQPDTGTITQTPVGASILGGLGLSLSAGTLLLIGGAILAVVLLTRK